jgi:hypothetical protein
MSEERGLFLMMFLNALKRPVLLWHVPPMYDLGTEYIHFKVACVCDRQSDLFKTGCTSLM